MVSHWDHCYSLKIQTAIIDVAARSPHKKIRPQKKYIYIFNHPPPTLLLWILSKKKLGTQKKRIPHTGDKASLDRYG